MWIHLGMLMVLVAAVYSNALHGEFVFDDQDIVLQNPVMQHIDNWLDAMRAGQGWRQLLYMTYGLNFLWSKLDTWSYHFVNILIHGINVLLVYFILRRLAPPNRAGIAALAGAAVFAVHTLFSSGVVYITARSSTLCATFYFGAVLLFLKAFPGQPAGPAPLQPVVKSKPSPSQQGRDSAASDGKSRCASGTGIRRYLWIVWLLLAAVSGFLAWGVKQEAIALPIFLAGMVWLRSTKKDWRLICGFAVLGAIPLAVMWVLREQLKGMYAHTSANTILVNAGFDTVLAPAAYFFTYVTAVVEYYLPRFILPIRLSADPHILTVEQWYQWEFIVAVLVLGALAVIALKKGHREPLLSVGIAALLLSPMTAYAVVPLADPILEYRSYIPGLGVALLAAWAALRAPWQGMAGFVLMLAVLTYSRNPVWNTAVSLWEDAAQKSPNKARTQFNLGTSFQIAGRTQDAINQYNKALAVKPQMWAAYSNLSALMVETGQWDEAERLLLKVTSSSPKYTGAWINLCVLYLRRNQTDLAVAACRSAVATNDGTFAAEYNLGEALRQKGDFTEALIHYERAEYLRPGVMPFKYGVRASRGP